MIQELTDTILDEPTIGRMGVTKKAFSMFKLARESVASISRKTLSSECRKVSEEAAKTHWDNKLTV